MAKNIGEQRLEYLHEELETLRKQTDDRQVRSKIGITERRYQRVLNGVEKVLLDHAAEIIAGEPYSEIVLWALDILGTDTDDWGWAPHKERADRMGW